MKKLLTLVSVSFAVVTGYGAELYWTNTLGGAWSTANNWSPPQVPEANDDAIFAESGTYTVTVDVEATIGRLILGASTGSQTLAILGAKLSITQPSTVTANGALLVSGGNLACQTNMTVGGELVWTGGTLSGPGVIYANNRMEIGGSDTKYLSAVTIVNSKDLVCSGSGTILGTNGPVITNMATGHFEIQGATRLDWNFLNGDYLSPVFVNYGRVLVKAEVMIVWYVINRGVFEARDAPVWSYCINRNEGVMLCDNALISTGICDRFVNRGLLGGRGITLRGLGGLLNVVNLGQVSPGFSAGKLEIHGTYQQRGGSLNIEIGGSSAGTSFDQLIVTNAVELGGQINVCLIDNFVPSPGDRFEIIKCASLSGSPSFNGLSISNGLRLEPITTATNVSLVVTEAQSRATPELYICRNGPDCWIWWPRGYESFSLQSTTDPGRNNWQPVSLTESNRYIVPSSGKMQFFRMVRP